MKYCVVLVVALPCLVFAQQQSNQTQYRKHILLAETVQQLARCCTSILAQYVTPAELQRQQEQQQRQRDDNEANAYIGKTFWYVPNPDALNRVAFLSSVPSGSSTQGLEFFPLSATSFLVTQVDGIQSTYSPILDKRYLMIRFPDEKVGYIDVKELKSHLYQGERYDFEEYLFSKPPAATVTKRTDSATPAKSRAMPRIGMTKEQVLTSTWGKPDKINRASGASGAREQWVYGSRYLYFEKGVLVGIDK